MKSSDQLTLKEFCAELFEAITDLEKRFLLTLSELTFHPEKILTEYVAGQRQNYFNVFRYLLVSLFCSYVTYAFLYSPSTVGGFYYHFILDSIKQNLGEPLAKGTLVIDQQAFNNYYLEYSRLMNISYKIFGLFDIFPLCIFGLLIFRPIGMTVVSWLVVATFLSAHLSFYSSLISLPYLLFSKNLLNLSFFIYGVAFLYFSYCLYRLGKCHQIRRPMLRAITASLLSVVMWGALTMGFGMGLSFYSMSYTPSFIKKVEKVETIEP